MLLTITTTGKVTLLIVAGLFIAWALITAIWIPKRNPDFPATLTVFLLVSSLFLVAQLGAVYWVTSTQEVETEAAEPPGESTTPAETTPAETNPGNPQPGADADVVAGKEVFESAGCVGCHTLADAGATGTVGPNLDEAKPPAEPRRHPRHERDGRDAAVQGAAEREADPGRRGIRVVRRRQVLEIPRRPTAGRQPAAGTLSRLRRGVRAAEGARLEIA